MGGRYEGWDPTPISCALLTSAALALLSTPLAAASQLGPPRPDSAAIEVSLITTGPGTAVSSRFGHAALRIRDAETGSDLAFSYGRSGLDAPPDASLLLQGRLPQGGGTEDAQTLLARYADEGRSIWIQTLDLSPVEIKHLIDDLSSRRGLGPPYHFFSANCSTELRDALDRAWGGALRARTDGSVSGTTTLRSLMSGFTATDPVLHTLANLLLGSHVDRPATRWEQMYLPATLRQGLRGLHRTDESGRRTSLVRREEVRAGTLPNQSPEPRDPFMGGYLVVGVALGGILAALGLGAPGNRAAHLSFRVAGTMWTLTSGLLGFLMLVLWFFSEPSLGQWNANLLLASPLALPLGVVAWETRLARALMIAILATSMLALVLMLLPGPAQSTGIFLALFLPAHLGLAWGIRRLGRPRAATTWPEAPDHL